MSFLDKLFSGFGASTRKASSVRATSAFPIGAPPSPELRVEAGVASDPGCVRTVNEDALRVIRPTTPEGMAHFGVLAVVCDGMGGHEAGEIASHLAL